MTFVADLAVGIEEGVSVLEDHEVGRLLRVILGRDVDGVFPLRVGVDLSLDEEGSVDLAGGDAFLLHGVGAELVELIHLLVGLFLGEGR